MAAQLRSGTEVAGLGLGLDWTDLSERLHLGASSGLGEDEAGLLPQQDSVEPPEHGGDTRYLGTVLYFYSNKSFHHTSSSHAGVPKMLFSKLLGRTPFPPATS